MKIIRWTGNLLLPVVSVVLVLGGAEFAAQKSGYKKLNTYYDSQAEITLGRPIPPKAPGEYRIFLFGESAAYGFPVSDRYSISKWLEKSFSYLLPNKRVRVINCGWVGKSSHEILEGALGSLRYQPDLYLLYAGNNEAFTSNRLYLDNHLYHFGLMLHYRSYFYRWLTTRVTKVRKFFMRGRVEKEYRNEAIARKIYATPFVSDADFERILKRYRDNMTTLVRAAKKKGVKVLFITLPANMKDFPPLLSGHGPGFTGREAEWNRLFETGRKEQEAGRDAEAIRLFEEAQTIDPKYAELPFRLAQSYEKAGRFEDARAAYWRARDFDAQPWRSKSALNEEIRKIAAENGVMFRDVLKAFEDNSPHGIVSTDLVFDNVHPSIKGQQLITNEILKELSENKMISAEGWQWAALENSRKNYPGEWEVDGALKAYQPILKGILSWEAHQYAEAIPELENGLSLMPDFVELYGFLGDAYFHMGKTEKAVETFRQFKQKNPEVFEFILKKYPEVQEGYSRTAGSAGV